MRLRRKRVPKEDHGKHPTFSHCGTYLLVSPHRSRQHRRYCQLSFVSEQTAGCPGRDQLKAFEQSPVVFCKADEI